MDAPPSTVQTNFTPLPNPPKNNKSKGLLIVLSILVVASILILAKQKFFKQPIQKAPITKSTSKNIIVVQTETKKLLGKTSLLDKIVSFNPTTKTTKTLISIPENSQIEEARVSPDGTKMYFTISQFPYSPHTITLLKQDGNTKEYDLLKSDLWTLSSPGTLERLSEKDCYWSPDSVLLACKFIEREKTEGDGTGRLKIIVLNTETEQVSDVFNNETIEHIQPAVISTRFEGWIDNNSLLLTRKAFDDLATPDIAPSEFYIYDIGEKKILQKFTYQYESSPHYNLTITPDGRILFTSISRSANNSFIEYDLASHKSTKIETNGDFITSILSEDKSKLVYITGALQHKYTIHIRKLADGQEEIVESPTQAFYPEELFSNEKSIILRKVPDDSVYFNMTTKEQIDLNGIYVGAGYF